MVKKRLLHFAPSHAKPVRQEKIADDQRRWASLIPTLKNYRIESVDSLSIAGEAPKDFVFDSEYRPGHRSRAQKEDRFIAKVGSKWYPVESITEQLITRIGQTYGLCIADSKLRLIDGQVRFLSKYFLNSVKESLTHGAEIYELAIGKDNYAPLRDEKKENEFFTFQMTVEGNRLAGSPNQFLNERFDRRSLSV